MKSSSLLPIMMGTLGMFSNTGSPTAKKEQKCNDINCRHLTEENCCKRLGSIASICFEHSFIYKQER